MLSEEQIVAMSRAERRALILRLRDPVEVVVAAPEKLRRLRRRRQLLSIGSSAVLVPWTVYLATSLPVRVVVDNWPEVWVGYNIVLIVMLGLTAWLGWRRRLAVVLTAFATGVLILADAYFDVLTSSADRDLWFAITAAVLIEIPVAWLLIGAAVRLLRLSMVRVLVLPPDTSLWRLPLPLLDDLDDFGRPDRPDRSARHA